MIGVSNCKQFAFVHISKTGGSSIRRALSPWSVPYDSLGGDTSCLFKHAKAHSTYVEFRDCYSASFDQFYTFAVVRNPFERLVSLYHYWRGRNKTTPHPYDNGLDTLAKNLSFHEWLRKSVPYSETNRHIGPQSPWIMQDGKIVVDYVGRFERLHESFDVICETLELGEVSLPHLRRTRHGIYRGYYDSYSRSIIESEYADDLERFGYRW